eukprot:scaffold35882_cov64-Attheya_sp.AAC.6
MFSIIVFMLVIIVWTFASNFMLGTACVTVDGVACVGEAPDIAGKFLESRSNWTTFLLLGRSGLGCIEHCHRTWLHHLVDWRNIYEVPKHRFRLSLRPWRKNHLPSDSVLFVLSMVSMNVIYCLRKSLMSSCSAESRITVVSIADALRPKIGTPTVTDAKYLLCRCNRLHSTILARPSGTQ